VPTVFSATCMNIASVRIKPLRANGENAKIGPFQECTKTSSP
jgi:hypothetical protein